MNTRLDPATARAAEVAACLATVERSHQAGIKKVRYTHDAMIDQIISNPWMSQGELAAYFGYTEGWVSIVINSDMFQARLAMRKEQVVDPTLRISLEERFRAVTARSLHVLQEKLSKDPSSVPDNLALRAAELGAKALGIGGNAPPPQIPGDHLVGLADRLLSLQSRVRTGAIHEQLQNVEVVEAREIVRSGHEGGSDGGQRTEHAEAPDSGESRPAA